MLQLYYANMSNSTLLFLGVHYYYYYYMIPKCFKSVNFTFYSQMRRTHPLNMFIKVGAKLNTQEAYIYIFCARYIWYTCRELAGSLLW